MGNDQLKGLSTFLACSNGLDSTPSRGLDALNGLAALAASSAAF